VPFCRHGFLPPPLTKPRVLVDTVPARRLASWLWTTACRRCSRTGPATMAAGTETSPTFSRVCDTTGIETVSAIVSASSRSGGPAPLAGARDVHALAGTEDVADLHLAADRRRLAVAQRELAQDGERAGARLRELPGERLRQALRLGGAEGDLRRGVALALGPP